MVGLPPTQSPRDTSAPSSRTNRASSGTLSPRRCSYPTRAFGASGCSPWGARPSCWASPGAAAASARARVRVRPYMPPTPLLLLGRRALLVGPGVLLLLVRPGLGGRGRVVGRRRPPVAGVGLLGPVPVRVDVQR